ncbi:hypothetical protein MICA_85 [Micavibrio aeruginosavorus ARL-13]|uniref:Uncharacterized protein n=1 Tax=Micavibrio aeruginosavorus (strain ARL-13) TaxID=856793 RepID=G2KMP5_MICAA|nr:hypothetical protein MICA_85 [Micavibrio aeruginosavorus ARL-13]
MFLSSCASPAASPAPNILLVIDLKNQDGIDSRSSQRSTRGRKAEQKTDIYQRVDRSI